MKLWKYLILIGGIVGVAGFFLPFVSYRSSDGRFTGSVSAYQVVRGIDDASEILHSADKLPTGDETKQVAKLFDESLSGYRGALAAFFGPAVALALLGVIVGARRRVGRLGGLLAVVLGLANAAVWLLFVQVSSEDADQTASLGVGLYMLLVAGVCGCIAGLGAIVAPDRGP